MSFLASAGTCSPDPDASEGRKEGCRVSGNLPPPETPNRMVGVPGSWLILASSLGAALGAQILCFFATCVFAGGHSLNPQPLFSPISLSPSFLRGQGPLLRGQGQGPKFRGQGQSRGHLFCRGQRLFLRRQGPFLRGAGGLCGIRSWLPMFYGEWCGFLATTSADCGV